MKHSYEVTSGMRRSVCYMVFLLLLIRTDPLHGEVIDRIVAIVNDSVITLSELNSASMVARERFGMNMDGMEEDTRTRVLETLIEQKLVKQASEKAGIDVSEKEIDNAIEDVKKQNRISHEELLSAIRSRGLTYEEYREQIREQIRQVKFITKEIRSKVSIQPEDIEDYYIQHIDEFRQPASYRIRVIYFGDTDRKLLKKKIGAVLDGIERGEDFSTLASRYSEGPTASSGGDLGYIKEGEMDETIEEVAKGLDIGEISEPFTTHAGTYIIQLVDRREGDAVPLEEVRDEIYDRLFEEAMRTRYRTWLEEMKKNSYIERRL